jgi:hypothetical protein
MNFEIKPVETKADKKKFVKSQWNFYKNDKYWVPPVIADRMKLIDTEKNPFYMHSEIKLFMAYRDGEVIGRIAAITNDNHNKIHKDKTGFWGFFESVNEQEVADALFDTAAEWLRSKGRDKMIGPENPSINDEIGMLFEGYDDPPMIMMTYNPPYYNDFCTNYGMRKAKDLYAYHLEPKEFQTEKMIRLQGLIRDRYDVKVREIDLKHKKQFEKDVQTLKDIYNAAWQPNWGFVKWTDEEFDFLAKDLKMVANQKMAVIVEARGKVAGFGLALPDMNQTFIYNRSGSLLGAVWNMITKKKKINRCRVIALGVMPEFQKTGIDVVLYYEVGTRSIEVGGYAGEASWILEDNEMMKRGLTSTMNATLYKKYRLYEKEI